MTPCWNSHRAVSDLTFEVLTWPAGEKRVPARSRLWSRQSSERAAFGCCAETLSRAEPIAMVRNDFRKTSRRVIDLVSLPGPKIPSRDRFRLADLPRHFTSSRTHRPYPLGKYRG